MFCYRKDEFVSKMTSLVQYDVLEGLVRSNLISLFYQFFQFISLVCYYMNRSNDEEKLILDYFDENLQSNIKSLKKYLTKIQAEGDLENFILSEDQTKKMKEVLNSSLFKKFMEEQRDRIATGFPELMQDFCLDDTHSFSSRIRAYIPNSNYATVLSFTKLRLKHEIVDIGGHPEIREDSKNVSHKDGEANKSNIFFVSLVDHNKKIHDGEKKTIFQDSLEYWCKLMKGCEEEMKQNVKKWTIIFTKRDILEDKLNDDNYVFELKLEENPAFDFEADMNEYMNGVLKEKREDLRKMKIQTVTV